MITSLSLENWKSHSSSSFTFGRGTNVLVGRMGSGKSSVLDALCFALYGTFPRLSRRDQTTEDLVSFASGAPYAAVALEFEKEGRKYKVERRIGRKISEAEVRLEGKLVQKGPKQSTDYVVGALGVDYELFTRAIYSEQNKIDYLLSLLPRARKQEIDWLLGLGQFDEAREAAQAVSGRLSEQAGLFAADSSPEKLEAAKRKTGELEAQAKGKGESCARLAATASELAGKLRTKESALSSLEKVRAEWRREQAECERQKGSWQRLTAEAEGKHKPSKEELGSAAAQRKRAEEAVSSAKAAAKKQQAELSFVKSELAVLESQKKLAEARAKRKAELEERAQKISGGKARGELEKEIAALKGGLDALSSEHARLHAEMGELSRAAEALLSGKGKCPVCDSDLSGGKAEKLGREKKLGMGEKRQLAEKRSAEMMRKKALIDSQQKALSELDICGAEISRLAGEGAGFPALQKGMEEKAARKKGLETDCEKYEQAVAESESQSQEARERSEEMQRTAKVFSELEASAARLKSSEEKLAKLNFDEAKYEAERKEAESTRVNHAKAAAEAAGEEKQLALLQEMLSLERQVFSSLEQKGSLARKYSEAAGSMAIYKNSLSSVQSEMRHMLVDEINQALCEIWPAVYPYSDYGGVKLAAEEKDYQLLMEKQGSWIEVDSVASGGERACLCLALRIAFATVLTPDIGWLILDEPTHNLDSDAVQMLSEAINTKIPSIVEQTFVITHDISLGEACEGKVFRLERDKSKNEPTRVAQL